MKTQRNQIIILEMKHSLIEFKKKILFQWRERLIKLFLSNYFQKKDFIKTN